MNEMDLLADLHRHTDRQGPGSEKDTLLAMALAGLPDPTFLNMADIGCGSGGQTLTLAKHLNGHITAVDIIPVFLEELQKRATQAGAQKKITTLCASMEDLPFEVASLDGIWSEGAIYSMGFERGVKAWKKFIKPGGFLAVSEITWTTHVRPPEIESYWMRECPEISTAAEKIRILEENDFTLTGYFVLPESSWTETYYKPLATGFDAFLERHRHTEDALKVIQEYLEEIAQFEKYKAYYSYGFYVGRKR